MSAPGPPPGSTASSANQAGERLGKYELIRRLATGGMAEIYLSRVQGLEGFQKYVVVKRILPQLATNREFVQMFLDEARIAATLHHPNIVQVYDIGSVGGSYFFSMEFLHGEDVRSVLKRARAAGKAIPIQHALNVIIGTCAGIHYAHEKVGFDGRPLGIVHRDMTPQNVFVTYDGCVKVVDFGIAKATNRFSETRYGTLKGKIPYMSPEQCRSDPLDRRSDVFSIAIMLYELTTGARLYTGGSEFEILKNIVERDPPPPSSRSPGYPPELERIVLKGLARDRERRYATAQEMQLDLEELARGERLQVSAIALARFMEELFGHKVEAWREVQRGGKDLAEHFLDAPTLDGDDLVEEPSGGLLGRLPGEIVSGSYAPPTLKTSVGNRIPILVGALVVGLAAAVGLLQPWRHRVGRQIASATLAPGPTSGRIEVVSLPAGAHVAIDGKNVPHPAPVEIDGLVLGKPIHVAAMLPGYQPWQGDVILTTQAPNQPVSIPLVPVARPVGVVHVKVSPPTVRASFFLDGMPASGATIPAVAVGVSHVLLVQAPGFKDAVVPVMLAPGEPVGEVSVALAPLTVGSGGAPSRLEASARTSAAGEGELSIDSAPWANVTIDGRPLGPTPQLHVKVSAGRHMIRLSNPTFHIDQSVELNVPAGASVKRRFSFPGG